MQFDGSDEFRRFFCRATGNDPFPYQERLATSEPLPQLLQVPTGAGKTAAVVLSWLWRRRFAEQSIRERTPRRLVFCLPMRVLAEQTEQATRKWLESLDLLAENPGDMRAAQDKGKRIAVSLLMGGEARTDWDGEPERDAVLIGTQDMLLSRALNRGYGMSRYRWPKAFAALNNDALWVVDETQLMGAGLPTTAQLQAFRKQMATFGPTHTIWMSATLQRESIKTVDLSGVMKCLELDQDDYASPKLARCLKADKPLGKAQTELTKEGAKHYPRNLAEEILEQHQPASLTLVIVNRVKRAQEIYRALEVLLSKGRKGELPNLLLIHSRFRANERRSLQEQLASAEATPGSGGTIAISTQAVEAGVDVSARTLFIEIAPWPSLVQRFGRCNRRGEFGAQSPAGVYWIDLEDEDEDLALPYRKEELALARDQIKRMNKVGPQEVSAAEVPENQEITQVLRRRDLLELFDTTPDLAGSDLDVSRFIREVSDADIQVCWREWEGERPPEFFAEPQRNELCLVPIAGARNFLKNNRVYHWDGLDKRWLPIQGKEPIWPGLTLLIRCADGGYSEKLGWTGENEGVVPQIPLPDDIPSQDANDDDPRVDSGRYITIVDHSDAVVEAMGELLHAFQEYPDLPGDVLPEAARYHDGGKGHQVFQDAMVEGLDDADLRRGAGPWAKRQGHAKYKRKHFRHELASALLALQSGCSDLVAYLTAAHHGKVRLSIRSLPGETLPERGYRYARGVWEGDKIQALDLGGGVHLPETSLRLGVMEMGDGDDGASWLERSLSLRDYYGPFRLAWLEMLLRVADARGSKETGR